MAETITTEESLRCKVQEMRDRITERKANEPEQPAARAIHRFGTAAMERSLEECVQRLANLGFVASILLALLITNTASAAMILLELRGGGTRLDAGSPQPVPISFNTMFGPPGPSLSGSFTEGQDGQSIQATPQEIAEFQQILSTSGASWSIIVFQPSPMSLSGTTDQLWTKGTAFVPQLGPGLTGYDLTQVELIFGGVQWQLEPNGNPRLNGTASAIVRIYGDSTVPEPAAAWLAVAALALCLRLRHIRPS